MKDVEVKKEQAHEGKTEEGNFQGHGSLSGSFLSSADRDARTTHAKTCIGLTPVDMLAAGHNAFVCLRTCAWLFNDPTQTHLFCPSQSSGYPASQPQQERITALCHVAVTSLSHVSSCHSLQGEKGRRRGARALLCQTATPTLPLIFVCLIFLSVLSVSIFSLYNSLSLSPLLCHRCIM